MDLALSQPPTDGSVNAVEAMIQRARQTMLYLGVDYQDMAHAMDLLAQYQKAVKFPEKGIFEVSQQNGGPCGEAH
jgi:hypothetical protein